MIAPGDDLGLPSGKLADSGTHGRAPGPPHELVSPPNGPRVVAIPADAPSRADVPMDRDPPEPQTFDPAQSPIPFLPDAPLGGGLVILVMASADAFADWAERTALALASGWAEKRQILLADLALGNPGLHQALGVENGEGMSDVLLFGCSVLRVARPVHERGFLFVSAGTATASPEVVAASPRWASVVDACHRIRATVVVFLPSDIPSGEHLLAQASDVFMLTAPSAERGCALQEGMGDRLRSVLVPPLGVGPAVQGEAQEAVDDFGFLEVESPVLAESPVDLLSGLNLETAFQEPEVEDSPSVDGATFVADVALSPLAPAEASEPDAPLDPDPISDDSASPVPLASASRSRVLVLLFLVVLVALVVAAWYGVVEIPWVRSRLFAPAAASALGPVALSADDRSFVPVLAVSLDTSGAYADAEEVK